MPRPRSPSDDPAYRRAKYDPEKKREQARRHYLKHRERILARNAAWRKANLDPEAKRAYDAAYYQAAKHKRDPAKLRANSRAYYYRHPEKALPSRDPKAAQARREYY
jgi:hypothetical protein